MQYPYRGRHAINRSARLADQAARIAQAGSSAQRIDASPVSVEWAKALPVLPTLPLRAIDLLDALGRSLQRLAAAARIRVARSPP